MYDFLTVSPYYVSSAGSSYPYQWTGQQPYAQGFVDPFDMTDTGTDPRRFQVNFSDRADTRAVDIGKALYPDKPDMWTSGRSDLFDPDPDGNLITAYGKLPYVNRPYGSTDVMTVNLFGGKQVSVDRLKELGEVGQMLLDEIEKSRTKGQRGFLEALMDFSFTDFIPGAGSMMRVNGKFYLGSQLSNAYDKVANGKSISDREAALITLDQMQRSRAEHGTMLAKAMDLVRGSIPYQMEFFLLGGIGGLARSTLTRAAAGSAEMMAKIGLSTAAKRFSRELSVKLVRDEIGKLAGKSMGEVATHLAKKETVQALTANLKTELKPLVSRVLSPALPENPGAMLKLRNALGGIGTYTEDFVDTVAGNLAERSLRGAVTAASQSGAFRRFASGTVDWAKDHATRGMFDFGHWASHSASSLYTNYTSASSALADALGILFVEAPIKGMIFTHAHDYLTRPMINAFTDARDEEGNRLGLVDNQVGNLKIEAVLKGDRRKYELAEAIAESRNFWEYASENAGAGFSALGNAIMIGTKIFKPGKLAFKGVIGKGLIADPTPEQSSWIGRMLRKAAGTSEEYGENALHTRRTAVRTFLEHQGITDIDANGLDRMFRTGNLPQSVQSLGFSDVNKLIKTAIKSEAKTIADNKIYRSYTRYVLADMMYRNGWGVDQTANALKRIGWDGVIEEMLEERYGEVANGMFGMNPANDGSFGARVKQAWEDLTLDPSKLAVEAMGFAIPGLVRNMAVMAQTSLGSTSELNRARAYARDLRAMKSGMNVVTGTVREFKAGRQAHADELTARRDEAQKELDRAREAHRSRGLTEEQIKHETVNEENAVAHYEKLLQSHNKNTEAALKAVAPEAVGVTEISEDTASKLINFAVVSSNYEEGSTRQRLQSVFTNHDIEYARVGQNNLVEDAAWMGERLYYAENRWQGESDDPATKAWWRRAASRLIGIGAAIITGDPAMAAVNALEWASVDEGADLSTIRALRTLYSQHRSNALRNMREKDKDTRAEIPEEELREKFWDEYEQEAKNFVNAEMLTYGLRMFSRTDMRDQVFRKIMNDGGYVLNPDTGNYEKESEDGTLSVVSQETALSDPTLTVSDKKGNPVKVAELHDRLTSECAVEVVRMLSDTETFNSCKDVDGTTQGIIKFLKTKPGDPQADLAAQCIAETLAGFGSKDVFRAVELQDGLSIEQALDEGTLQVPQVLAERIVRDYDASKTVDAVSDKDVETVMRQILGDTLADASDGDLRARKAKVVRICRLITDYYAAARSERAFIIHLDREPGKKDSDVDPDETYNGRFTTTNTRQIRFHKDKKSGKWMFRVRATVKSDDELERSSDPAMRLYRVQATDEELTPEYVAEVLGNKYDVEEVKTGIVLTSRQNIVSHDGLLLARHLGLAWELRDKGVKYEPSGVINDEAVDPLLRLDIDGNPLFTVAEANDRRAREIAMAEFYVHHKDLADYNFDGTLSDVNNPETRTTLEQRLGQHHRMYNNVLGEESGYMWRLNNLLEQHNVLTPKLSPNALVYQAVAESRGYYVLPVNVYHAVTQSGQTYVPIDYGRGEDGTAGLVNAIISRGVLTNYHAFAKDGLFHDTVRDFVRHVRLQFDKRIYDPATDAALRRRLMAARDSIASSPDHPHISDIVQLTSAYVLDQLARSKVENHAVTRHDEALREIERDVKNSTATYLKFCAVMDVAIGGNGWAGVIGNMKSASKSEVDPSLVRGVTRLSYILNQNKDVADEVYETYKDIMPYDRSGNRMGYGEVLPKLTDALKNLVKVSVNSVAPDNAAPKQLGPVWNHVQRMISDIVSKPEELTFEKFSAVIDATFGETGPGAQLKYAKQWISTYNDFVARIEDALAAAEARVKEEKKAAESGKTEDKPDDAKSPETTVKELKELLEQAKLARSAALQAGDTAALEDESVQDLLTEDEDEEEPTDEPTPTEETITEEEAEEEAEEDEGESLSEEDFFKLNSTFDFEDTNTPDVTLELMGDNTTARIITELPKESGLDTRATQYTSVLIYKLMQISGVSDKQPGVTFKDSERGEFRNIVDTLLGPGALDETTLGSVFNTYNNYVVPAVAKNPNLSHLTFDAFDETNEDTEGEQSSDAELFRKSTMQRFDNASLNSFLQIFDYVSPETHRSFLGILTTLRDNADRLLESFKSVNSLGAADTGVKVFEHIRNLVAPRAMIVEGSRGHVDNDGLYTQMMRNFDEGVEDMTMADIVNYMYSGRTDNSPVSRKIGLFLLYLSALPSAHRIRFMELAGSTPLGVVELTQDLKLNTKLRKRAPFSARTVSKSFNKVVADIDIGGYNAKSPTGHLAAINRLRVQFAQSMAVAIANNEFAPSRRLVDRMRAVARVLEPVLGDESPMVQALMSDNYWATLVARGYNDGDLVTPRKAIDSGLSYQLTNTKTKYKTATELVNAAKEWVNAKRNRTLTTVALEDIIMSAPDALRTVANILSQYGENYTSPTPNDATRKKDAMFRAALSVVTSGLSTESARSAEKSAENTSIWEYILSGYMSSFPETVRPTTFVPGRSKRVTSKTVLALASVPSSIQQFLDRRDDDPSSFAALAYGVWKANASGLGRNKTLMRMYPEFAKFSTNATNPARTPENRAAWAGARDKWLTEHEEEIKAYFNENVLPVCKRDMKWPDDVYTPILVRNLTPDYTASEVFDACRADFNSNLDLFKEKPAFARTHSVYVQVFAGEHSSATIMQVPFTALCGSDAGMPYKSVAELLADRPGEEPKNPADSFYNKIGRHVSVSMLHQHLLGKDAKRSAINVTEAPGHCLAGTVKNADGSLTRGECRVHVLHSFGLAKTHEKGNEALLGSTFGMGYGFKLLREIAQNPNSLQLKLHIMSALGDNPELIKSLVNVFDEEGDRGQYMDGTVQQILFQHIRSLRKNNGLEELVNSLSSDLVTDDDSLKVGVLNSKNLRVINAEGKAVTLKDYIFEKLSTGMITKTKSVMDALGDVYRSTADASKYDAVPVLSMDQIDQIVGRFRWTVDGATPEKKDGEDKLYTVSEILNDERYGTGGDINISVIPGLGSAEDPTIDFSFVNNTLMGHRVANVSHEAKPEVDRLPTNNVIDALTLGILTANQSNFADKEHTVQDMIDVLSGWNIANGAATFAPESIAAQHEQSEKIKMMIRDQHLDPRDTAVRTQLAYEMSSKYAKARTPQVNRVPCPLVSSGARMVYNEKTGEYKFIDHSNDKFLRAIHYGGQIFGAKNRKLFNARHRDGLAQFNSTPDSGVRNMWFVEDRSKLSAAFTEVFKIVSDAYKPKGATGDATSLELKLESKKSAMAPVIEATVPTDLYDLMESLFSLVHYADLRFAEAVAKAREERRKTSRKGKKNPKWADSLAAIEEGKTALAARRALAKAFVDHHGLSVASKCRLDFGPTDTEGTATIDAFLRSIGFDDLFCVRADGTFGFDRTAVYQAMPAPKGVRGDKVIALAGTKIGLPRTPSYNGSMWLTVCRVSIPCTEVTVRDKDGKVIGWRPGADAMVMPDAQSLEILGCDHDGDKSACYMYGLNKDTGTADFLEDPSAFIDEAGEIEDIGEWADSKEQKAGYLKRLRDKRLVDYRAPEKVFDKRTGTYKTIRTGYSVPEPVRRKAGNVVIRGIFALADTRNMGDPAQDTKFLVNESDFTKPTKAQPLDVGGNLWGTLINSTADSPFNYLKPGATIADPYTAALISTSAQNADESRGRMVAAVRRLHFGIMSGAFNGTLFGWGGSGALTAAQYLVKWLNFTYGIDGISNATFDDIKEQVCSRMGWTPAMFDIIISDILVRVDGNWNRIDTPTTAAELNEVLSAYTNAVTKFGSRFYMVLSSTPATVSQVLRTEEQTDETTGEAKKVERTGADIRELMRKPYRAGMISQDTAEDLFHIWEDPESHLRFVSDEKPSGETRGYHLFAQALGDVIQSCFDDKGKPTHPFMKPFYKGFNPETRSMDKPEKVMSRVLGMFLRNIASGDGVNPHVGFAYWAADKIVKAEEEAREAIAKAKKGNVEYKGPSEKRAGWNAAVDAARDYFRLMYGLRNLQVASDFVDATSCFNVNPADSLKTARRNERNDKFAEFLDSHYLPPSSLRAMKALATGTAVAYSMGDVLPPQAQAGLSVRMRDDVLFEHAQTMNIRRQAYQRLIIGLMAEDPEPASDPTKLDAAAASKAFFMAQLLSMPELKPGEGTDLFSGRHGLHTWEAMKAISRAVSKNDEGKGATSQSTIAFCEGVCAIFNMLTMLVSTSTLAARYPGLKLFGIRKDYNISASGYQQVDDYRWEPSSSTTGKSAKARGERSEYYDSARRIVTRFTDRDVETRSQAYQILRELAELTTPDSNGKRLPLRKRGYTIGNDTATFAKTFALTVKNIDGLLMEFGENIPARIRRDAELVKRILGEFTEKTKRTAAITPIGFIKQILPLYTTITTKTTLTEAANNSVMAYIPAFDGSVGSQYSVLSRKVAQLTTGAVDEALTGTVPAPGHRLMDLVTATKLGLISYSNPRHSSHSNEQYAPNLLTKELTSRFAEDATIAEDPEDLRTDFNNHVLAGILPSYLKHPSDHILTPLRWNPGHAQHLGVLENLLPFQNFHEVCANAFYNVPEKPDQTTEPEPEADTGAAPSADVPPEIKTAVGWLRGMLGDRASVVARGNGLVTIKFCEGLKGTAPLAFTRSSKGHVNLAINIRFGANSRDTTPRKLDVNSPTVAASFVEAVSKLGITTDEFLALPHELRESLLKTFTQGALEQGPAGYSLAMPSWTFTSDHVAFLCGEMHVADPKDQKTLFHEYFHVMMGVFRTLGMFSQEDIDTLVNRFGRAPNGTSMLFNEEKAADEFAEFVRRSVLGHKVRETKTADEAVTSIWQKVLMYLKALYNAFKTGFSHSDSPDALFSFAIDGYAAQSASRLNELGLDANSEEVDKDGNLAHLDTIAERLATADRLIYGIKADEERVQRTRIDTAPQVDKVVGDNISSKAPEGSLARRLTNPFNEEGFDYNGRHYRNAEHAYQTLKSGKFDQVAYENGLKTNGKPKGSLPVDKKNSYKIMLDIISAKLRAHPDLVDMITERGGLAYLAASRHEVNGDEFWEKKGKFMKALTAAYYKLASGPMRQMVEAKAAERAQARAMREDPAMVYDSQIKAYQDAKKMPKAPAWMKLDLNLQKQLTIALDAIQKGTTRDYKTVAALVKGIHDNRVNSNEIRTENLLEQELDKATETTDIATVLQYALAQNNRREEAGEEFDRVVETAHSDEGREWSAGTLMDSIQGTPESVVLQAKLTSGDREGFVNGILESHPEARDAARRIDGVFGLTSGTTESDKDLLMYMLAEQENVKRRMNREALANAPGAAIPESTFALIRPSDQIQKIGSTGVGGLQYLAPLFTNGRKSVIVLDTETSGLYSHRNMPVQISAVKIVMNENGKVSIPKDGLFNQFIRLPEGVTPDPGSFETSGIDLAALRSPGNDYKGTKLNGSLEALKEFAEFIGPEKALFVAQNASFDAQMLLAAWERATNGDPELRSNPFTQGDWLDALSVYRDRAAYDRTPKRGHATGYKTRFNADGSTAVETFPNGTPKKATKGHSLEAMMSHYNRHASHDIPTVVDQFLKDRGVETTGYHDSMYDTCALTALLGYLAGERNDLEEYVNIFGYVPSHGTRTTLHPDDHSDVNTWDWTNNGRLAGIVYAPQWVTSNLKDGYVVSEDHTLPKYVRNGKLGIRPTETETSEAKKATRATEDAGVTAETLDAAERALAAVNQAVIADPVEPGAREDVYGDKNYDLIGVALRAAYNQLSKTDKDILNSKGILHNPVNMLRVSLAAKDILTEDDKAQKRELEETDKVVRGAAKILQDFAGPESSANFFNADTLNVLYKLVDGPFFRQASERARTSKFGAITDALLADGSHIDVMTKTRVSANDIAAAVMTVMGEPLGSTLERLAKSFVKARESVTGSDAETLDHLIVNLRRLAGATDPTMIIADPKAWQDAVTEFMANVFAGIRMGRFNPETDDYGPYVPAEIPPLGLRAQAAENIDRYHLGSEDDPVMMSDRGVIFRQRALRLAAEAALTTAAQIKFCREVGMQPGVLTGNPLGAVDITLEDFARQADWLGISANHLTSPDPIVQNSCTPFFIAANLDSTLEASVRGTLGHLGLRDMVMGSSKTLRGHMAVITDAVNLKDSIFAIDCPYGTPVLRLKKYTSTHTMEDGSIRAQEEGERKEYIGVDRFHGFRHGDTTDALTLDEWRTQYLLGQMSRLVLMGERRLITGAERLRFTPEMFIKGTGPDGRPVLITAEDLDYHALKDRYEKLSTENGTKDLTEMEYALWRLGYQWHGFVTGNGKSADEAYEGATMGIYRKAVETILEARKQFYAQGVYEERYESQGLSEATALNDYIIGALESKALVVGQTVPNGGKRLYKTAAFCIDLDAFKREYVNTSGYKMLTDPARGGREAKMLTPEYGAEMLADKIKDVWRELKHHPWLNTTDMAYMNDFRSLIPAYVGTGAFMAGVKPVDDHITETYVDNTLSRYEDTYREMCDKAETLGKRSYTEMTDAMLGLVQFIFKTEEKGGALMQAFLDGKYSDGQEASKATGLVVRNDSADSGSGTSILDISDQIYGRLISTKISALEGKQAGKDISPVTVGRMLKAYEAAAENSRGTVLHAMGMTDSQLYRERGVLPANMTAGHAVITMMRGLQNALYFKNTLINMLFTPAEDGTPLYIADPGNVGPDAQVVPDAVWSMLAKWWYKFAGIPVRDAYADQLSGLENAKRAYAAIAAVWGKTKKINGADFVEMSREQLSSGVVSHMLVRVNVEGDSILDKALTANSVSEAFGGKGGVALGYAKHLFYQLRSRTPNLVMKSLQHLNAWSKTMSVACSMFFNIATQWESATAATGFMATLMSNVHGVGKRNRSKVSPDTAKKNGTIMKLGRMAQKAASLGQGTAWLDENFLGFQDIIRMMDTNDPFLADLYVYAESIGITMSKGLNNPMEENKSIVAADLERMAKMLRGVFKSKAEGKAAVKAMYEGLNAAAKTGGEKVVDSMEGLFNTVVMRRGEKTFNYALNATKLAVAAQIAMRLKREAIAAGRSFDPIRDMRGYAEYIDSEIGGVNPLRYAWAHPGVTNFLSNMFFSWQWTRTAWEAAGGGVLEDILMGTHNASKQQRSVTLARWARMFLAIQFAFPMLLQILAKAIGLALGHDDDRDKWFTWQNEQKSWLFGANLRPLLMGITKFDYTISNAIHKSMNNGQELEKLPGKDYGYGYLGKMKTSDNLAFNLLTCLVPMYTSNDGHDEANTTGYRAIYTHGGKQGFEVPRWFTDPGRQLKSKLSLPAQKTLDVALSILGINSADAELGSAVPGSDYVPGLQRVNPLSKDFFAWHILGGSLSPFSYNTISTKGDSGFIGMMLPVQYGESMSNLRKEAAKLFYAYAMDDESIISSSFAHSRTGKRWSNIGGRHSATMNDVLVNLRRDAAVNGISPETFKKHVVIHASNKVRARLYTELFGLLPKDAKSDVDVRAIRKVIRALIRLDADTKTIKRSLNEKFGTANRTESLKSPEYRGLIIKLIKEAYADPYGFNMDRSLDRLLTGGL